jgi:hypothetical protein
MLETMKFEGNKKYNKEGKKERYKRKKNGM